MTLRERIALTLVALGVLFVVAAAWAYDGARGVVAVLGALCLLGGVLLGLGDDDAELEVYDVDTGERLR